MAELSAKPETSSKISTVKDSSSSSKLSSVNLLDALIEHNKALDVKLNNFEQQEQEKSEKIKVLKNDTDELKKKLKDIEEEYETLRENDSKTDEDDTTSQEIQKLLATYERLKSDEKQFKEMCHEELERLQAMSAQAEDKESPQSEIHSQLDRAKTKVEAGRRELATISRNLATLRRQIDQVPNRTELREYRLRFAELYNQVSATHRQTKHFFSLYNSLEDTKRYLEKELSLLNSIVDSYQLACSTASGREDFSRQLSTLYDGMKDTCSKVDKRFQTEKLSVAKLQQELQSLVEQKVAYEKCLRDLETECKINDQLLATCKKLRKKQ